MNEYYPTLLEMTPGHKTYPVTWFDGWHVFRGPKIESVAPDGYVVVRSNEPKMSLHTLINQSDKKFFVIVFDGIHHGDTTVESKAFADELEKDFSDLLDCFVVTRYYEATQYDPINNILGDVDLGLEKKFGASGQCVYVLDREKKIVRKSSGFIKEKLYFYLKSLQKSV